MSEEKPKEEKPTAQSLEPKAQSPQPIVVGAGQKKVKKINKMTMKELDKTLEDVQQKMGNLKSKYALELLKRKRELAG
ncbi:MAG: hypothetical protein V2A72_05595 [Candidatus Omnitrophota bacterium]